MVKLSFLLANPIDHPGLLITQTRFLEPGLGHLSESRLTMFSAWANPGLEWNLTFLYFLTLTRGYCYDSSGQVSVYIESSQSWLLRQNVNTWKISYHQTD